MKRYLLFAGPYYYLYGGWDDFKGDFDTIEEAREATPGDGHYKWQWHHIVDTHTKKIVESRDPYSKDSTNPKP